MKTTKTTTDITTVQYVEQVADIEAPDSGFWRIFFKSTGAWIRKNASGAIRLLTTNDLMGDVGIGTASPAARLDVWGSIAATLIRFVNSTTASVSNGVYFQFLLKTDAAQRAALQIVTSFGIIADGTRTAQTAIAWPVQGVFDNRILFNSAGNVEFYGNMIGLSIAKTPANATAAGVTGSICWDTNYIYICVATNTWKRVAIASW